MMNLCKFPVLRRSLFVTLVLATLPPGTMASETGGRVLYSTSGLPVSGAYVLAAYTHRVGTIFGHSSRKCTATRGMYTSSDGAFSFPAAKDRDIDLVAIKPGYTNDLSRRIYYERSWYGGSSRKQSPDLYLKPTTGGDGSVNFAFFCDSPASGSDLRANLEYLRLVYAETKKFASPAMQANVQAKIDIMESNMR